MKTIEYSSACRYLPHAIQIAMGAVGAGNNAWIERKLNKDCGHPIKIENPALNDLRAWVMAYGTPEPDKRWAKTGVQQILADCAPCYGTAEAVEAYYQTGKLTADNLLGAGVCHAVMKVDIEAYYKSQRTGKEVCTGYHWHYSWKPRNDLPYYVPDPEIGEVWVVMIDDEPLDERACLLRLAQFINEESSNERQS